MCKIVFFSLGEGCTQEGQCECLALVDKVGYFLANHSTAHPFTSSITTEEFIEELEKTQKILDAYENSLKIFCYLYLDYGNIASK
jgi:peptidoglycan/xylan/chitin deacetylase (PgdA/CDA1 family)